VVVCLLRRFAVARFGGAQGDDLHMDLKMHVMDAWCGFSTSVKGIDGNSVPLAVTKAPTDNQLRLRGHGMPRKGGGRGDLILRFMVKYPDLTEDQKRRLRSEFGSGMLN
jgi:DnaJ-class molecular chaperone